MSSRPSQGSQPQHSVATCMRDSPWLRWLTGASVPLSDEACLPCPRSSPSCEAVAEAARPTRPWPQSHTRSWLPPPRRPQLPLPLRRWPRPGLSLRPQSRPALQLCLRPGPTPRLRCWPPAASCQLVRQLVACACTVRCASCAMGAPDCGGAPEC